MNEQNKKNYFSLFKRLLFTPKEDFTKTEKIKKMLGISLFRRGNNKMLKFENENIVDILTINTNSDFGGSEHHVKSLNKKYNDDFVVPLKSQSILIAFKDNYNDRIPVFMNTPIKIVSKYYPNHLILKIKYDEELNRLKLSTTENI